LPASATRVAGTWRLNEPSRSPDRVVVEPQGVAAHPIASSVNPIASSVDQMSVGIFDAETHGHDEQQTST
jgi:hypothetical protein